MQSQESHRFSYGGDVTGSASAIPTYTGSPIRTTPLGPFKPIWTPITGLSLLRFQSLKWLHFRMFNTKLWMNSSEDTSGTRLDVPK
ncbi:Protein of unknown function [Cotesia congregata]|uniref:Uncharacterized protein n=1 Tax=Cotesia congregata TaxID=51543 RepID=A0A8J2MHD7_COTCN|nr:Protein of unknown function [Cotesia congregata]